MSQDTSVPESSLIVEMPSENGIDNPALQIDDQQQPHSGKYFEWLNPFLLYTCDCF